MATPLVKEKTGPNQSKQLWKGWLQSEGYILVCRKEACINFFPPHMTEVIPSKWPNDRAALAGMTGLSLDSAQILALLLSWLCGRMEPE